MRETGLRYMLRAILRGIGAAVFGMVLVVGGFLVGLTIGHSILAFGLSMLGVVLSLFLAQWFSSSLQDTPNDPFALRLRTSWKLCDPDLRNSGVWRADLEPGSLDAAGLDDPTRVRQDIERLIADWSYRIGYPYYHCRVTGVEPAVAPKARSPNDGSRTFRVTLDLGGGEPGERPHQEFGWLCIGVGLAEFQLEPLLQPQARAFARAIRDFKVDGIDISLLPTFEIAQARNEPMWDRWIDD
jgi:hypothetical protein